MKLLLHTKGGNLAFDIFGMSDELVERGCMACPHGITTDFELYGCTGCHAHPCPFESDGLDIEFDREKETVDLPKIELMALLKDKSLEEQLLILLAA